MIFYFIIKSQALRTWHLSSICAKQLLLRRKMVRVPWRHLCPQCCHRWAFSLSSCTLSRNHQTACKSIHLFQHLVDILLDSSFDRTIITPIHLIMFSTFNFFLSILNWLCFGPFNYNLINKVPFDVMLRNNNISVKFPEMHVTKVLLILLHFCTSSK